MPRDSHDARDAATGAVSPELDAMVCDVIGYMLDELAEGRDPGVLACAEDAGQGRIEAAFAEGNLDQAECESHALKGVAGNLSLTSLHQLATRMNDLLKAHDEQAATALLPTLDEAYSQAIEALEAVLRK